MKNLRTAALLGGAIATLGLAIAAPANAGTMHNGWNYTVDSFRDGSGGEKYNIRGLAIKETDERIFVGLTGGTKREAGSTSAVYDNIGWADMFFNFTPENDFTDLIEDYGAYDKNQKVYEVKDEYKDSLLAIKFAPHDQGGELGLYSVNSLKGITKENRGYATMDAYKGYLNKGDGRAMGDLATKNDVYDYFGQNQRILNVVEDGEKFADIALLEASDLAAEGLDFNDFFSGSQGDYTFGFSLEKDALEGYLPGGMSEFMAHIVLECANDGIALAGTFEMPEENDEAVPEPSALLGLSAIGLAFFRKHRYFSKQ